MGIGASKSKESKKGATTKLGKGVVIPEDTEPYPGFQVQYHMIDVQVCVYNVTTFKYTSITPSPSIKRSLTKVPEIISWPRYYVHLLQPVLSMSVSDRLMQPWLYQACVVAVLNATLGNLTPINLMYRNAGNRYLLLANWSTQDPYAR